MKKLFVHQHNGITRKVICKSIHPSVTILFEGMPGDIIPQHIQVLLDDQAVSDAADLQEDQDEINQIKAMVSNINSSSLAVWHKKLLKWIIRKLAGQ